MSKGATQEDTTRRVFFPMNARVWFRLGWRDAVAWNTLGCRGVPEEVRCQDGTRWYTTRLDHLYRFALRRGFWRRYPAWELCLEMPLGKADRTALIERVARGELHEARYSMSAKSALWHVAQGTEREIETRVGWRAPTQEVMDVLSAHVRVVTLERGVKLKWKRSNA